MNDEKWNARFDELDTEIMAVQDVAYNAHLPSIAIALALIDAGVIDRKKLIAITELLHDVLATKSEPGTIEEAGQALDEFHHWLSMPLQPSDTQRRLEHLERSLLEEAFQRRSRRKQR